MVYLFRVGGHAQTTAFDGKSEVMICDDVQCTYKLYLRVRRIFIITYYFYYFALL